VMAATIARFWGMERPSSMFTSIIGMGVSCVRG